jgi:hypothetical protein
MTNDLTFAATLLSILVTLAAAVCAEATRAPAIRSVTPALVQANPARVVVASASSTNCACTGQVIAQAAGR